MIYFTIIYFVIFLIFSIWGIISGINSYRHQYGSQKFPEDTYIVTDTHPGESDIGKLVCYKGGFYKLAELIGGSVRDMILEPDVTHPHTLDYRQLYLVEVVKRHHPETDWKASEDKLMWYYEIYVGIIFGILSPILIPIFILLHVGDLIEYLKNKLK